MRMFLAIVLLLVPFGVGAHCSYNSYSQYTNPVVINNTGESSNYSGYTSVTVIDATSSTTVTATESYKSFSLSQRNSSSNGSASVSVTNTSSSTSTGSSVRNCSEKHTKYGGIFGPIPDTSYCNVFGPVPTHEQLFYPNGR